MPVNRIILLASALAAGACSTTPPPSIQPTLPAQGCSSSSVTIAFDFEGASQSRCAVEGEREFSILVEPEHAPPINPSPWYAFRYSAQPGDDVAITLRYDGADHRYPPEWRSGGAMQVLDIDLFARGRTATFAVPAGAATVSAQELFTGARYEALLDELTANDSARRITLGQSRAGRPIEALTLGQPTAPNLIVLLGRAHPPEVSGAVAMESFLRRIAQLVTSGRLDPARFQVLAVPLLNPDGVALGHWRANLGATDLNRDWGIFAQPETAAVKAWLDALPEGVTPAVMLDFHSTERNLFYVQGAGETTPAQEQFLQGWLGQQAGRLPGYDFTIERPNANPGSGTSKNWFNAAYAIPAYTYEAGDEVDRTAAAAAAVALADSFAENLLALADAEQR